ncbi:MAG TPA: biotin-dependent carboxyltransferase family protein [Candidatus Acidoferrales bacterium]|nr:biotin-dependent carboxyltransferase family protein [Candidatus Acidoferrales bacterium]
MIHIEVAGFGSTVQDLGRPGHVREGVPVSGPADPVAFRAAQALVGNSSTDAAIEAVGLPFTFRCDSSRLVAVTGREVSVTVRDRLPGWTAVFVRAGDLVRVSGTERSRYTYIAVSGGVASEAVLGSRAAYPRIGFGRALQSGDALALGQPHGGPEDAGASLHFIYGERAGASAGPHVDRFDDAAIARFFSEPFTLSAQSDRQGARLDGVVVAPKGGELLSCGIVTGAVQVPRGGQPIVALADHGTTGGYPIIATVIGADIGQIAQRAPGETLHFYRVERDAAHERSRVQHVSLFAS